MISIIYSFAALDGMKTTLFLLAALILVSLIACTPSPDTVKIGAVLALTGPAASYGEEARNGIELAAFEINANGGINGKRVEVLYQDDQTDPKQSVTAFTKLADVDHVSGMIGGTWDFNYNAIAPLAEQYHITLITPQNVKTTGTLTNNYTFIMRPELGTLTKTLEDYLKQNQIKRIAIVRFVSVFGEDIAGALKDMAKRLGGELIRDETYGAIGGNEFQTTITKLKQLKPDAVFLDMVDTDYVNFLQRRKELGLNATILTHAGVNSLLPNPNLDKSLFYDLVYFDWDTPPSEGFIQKYHAKHGRDPTNSADGAYDSMMILSEALSHTSPEQAHQYLQTHHFTTANGEFSFKNQVISNRDIFVKQVTPEGVKILEKKTILT